MREIFWTAVASVARLWFRAVHRGKMRYLVEEGTTKTAEERIVSDAVGGRVRTVTFTTRQPYSEDTHVVGLNRNVEARIDRSHGCGTYVFVWVDGVDMSYQPLHVFDYERVARALLEGRDFREGGGARLEDIINVERHHG
jgi:hypothetical protein